MTGLLLALAKKRYFLFCKIMPCVPTNWANQKIHNAPLPPIPAMFNPFEHLIVHCVGPLPQSMAGNSFLLTVICQSTGYPTTYPLRSITTHI